MISFEFSQKQNPTFGCEVSARRYGGKREHETGKEMRWDEMRSDQSLSCVRLFANPPGSSLYGILLVRILEWVAFPFSRGSSQTRDWIWVSHNTGSFFTIWAPRVASKIFIYKLCVYSYIYIFYKMCLYIHAYIYRV